MITLWTTQWHFFFHVRWYHTLPLVKLDIIASCSTELVDSFQNLYRSMSVKYTDMWHNDTVSRHMILISCYILVCDFRLRRCIIQTTPLDWFSTLWNYWLYMSVSCKIIQWTLETIIWFTSKYLLFLFCLSLVMAKTCLICTLFKSFFLMYQSFWSFTSVSHIIMDKQLIVFCNQAINRDLILREVRANSPTRLPLTLLFLVKENKWFVEPLGNLIYPLSVNSLKLCSYCKLQTTINSLDGEISKIKLSPTIAHFYVIRDMSFCRI